MKWAIKLPYAEDCYIYVTEFVDGYDHVAVLLFDTEEEALDVSKKWKNPKVVQYEPGN